MSAKEAKARIKINKLLEDAGWRFFENESGPANIQVETNVKLSKKQIDELGDDFEKTKNGCRMALECTMVSYRSTSNRKF